MNTTKTNFGKHFQLYYLIFTNQSNIFMDSETSSTLHSKCHRQIIYSKLNLKIEYAPPYAHEIWDNNRAETDLINCAIENYH